MRKKRAQVSQAESAAKWAIKVIPLRGNPWPALKFLFDTKKSATPYLGCGLAEGEKDQIVKVVVKEERLPKR